MNRHEPMLPKLRRYRPDHTTIVAYLALFVVLGGSSYAAVRVAKNSVGAKQIKTNAVRAAEVKSGAVGGSEARDGGLTGADLGDGSIGLGDLGANSVNGSKVADGSLGGTDIASGGSFLSGNVTVQLEQAAADLADGTSTSYNAFCPAGDKALGGGARGDFEDSEATNIGSSRPAQRPGNTEPPLDGQAFTGWRATVANPTGGVTTGIRPEVWVICSPAP